MYYEWQFSMQLLMNFWRESWSKKCIDSDHTYLFQCKHFAGLLEVWKLGWSLDLSEQLHQAPVYVNAWKKHEQSYFYFQFLLEWITYFCFRFVHGTKVISWFWIFNIFFIKQTNLLHGFKCNSKTKNSNTGILKYLLILENIV